jgi:hypothetical protein
MTDIAQLIEDMVIAGVAPELIGRTAAAFAAHGQGSVKDEQAERRRAKDRERKRLRNSAESADSTTPSPDKEIPPTPPKEINPNPIPPSPPKGGSSPTPDRFPKPEIVLQSEIDPMTAKRWCSHWRKSRGKTMSDETAEGQAAILREWRSMGGNAVAAVGLAIDRGWTSFSVEYFQNAGLKCAAPPKPKADDSDWRARLEAWRTNETWAMSWGPKPGERNCRVPLNLLEAAA